MEITAIVLSKNEEADIACCLKSLSWCSDIIVVDDYSEDATTRIAKKMGARVLWRHLNGDYAAQRNFGLSHSQKDWTLFIDADEIVPRTLASEIQRRVDKEDYAVYKIQRIDYFYDRFLRYGETGHMYLTRLAKTDSGTWFRSVHEQWEVRGKVGKLVSPLYHYPHKDIRAFLEKINCYTTLNARYLKDSGVSTNGIAIVAYPIAKFLKNYFFLAGFRDSMPGFIHAMLMSFHAYLTRAKLWHLYRRSINRD